MFRPSDIRSLRMAEVSRDLEGQPDEDSTYVTSTRQAVGNVGGCDAASLTIVRGRRDKRHLETRGASNDQARHADHLQHATGEGPCLDAAREELVVHSPSLAYDQRWPTWGPRVVAVTGFHSILSVRLFSNSQVLGSLNLYAYGRNAFDHEDHVDAIVIAAHIAVAVVAAQNEQHLQTALGSRTVIGQATGVLMERYGLSPDAAFNTLTRAASSQERKCTTSPPS